MSTEFVITTAPPPKSKSKQLAKLLPGIEAALGEGYSHEVIHAHIKTIVGLDLSFKYYKTTLHRIRKKRDQAKDPRNARPGLPRPVVVEKSSVGQSNQDASAALDESGRRFTYDVKSSIDDFF